MDEAEILIERHGEIEIITLNRPSALNTLSEGLTGALTGYFSSLPSRLDVRVIILRANGRAFCGGLDLDGWKREEGVTPALHILQVQTRIGNVYRLMRACPQPIIALGHGAACGGGLSLLLASDIRLGSPDLRMNAAYIKIGLGGCDMAASYLLPRLVGSSLAAEMLLTGRFVHADRALRLGLLSEVVEHSALRDAAMALAREMLLTSPWGLRLTKQAMNLNLDAPSMEAAMALEDRQQVLLSVTQDHQEAVSAFFEKRAPVYRGN